MVAASGNLHPPQGSFPALSPTPYSTRVKLGNNAGVSHPLHPLPICLSAIQFENLANAAGPDNRSHAIVHNGGGSSGNF